MATVGNTVEVRIPILKREVSVLENEFGSHSDQFAQEMRKMEEEMGRLTNQISEGNQRLASRIVKTTTTTTTRTTSSGGASAAPTPLPQQQPVQVIQYSPPSQPQISQNVAGSTVTSSTHTTRTTTHSSSTGGQQQQQFIPQQHQQNTFSNQQQQQYLTNTSQQQYFNDVANNQEVQQWLGQLNSPLIADHQDISGQDGKCLRLRFDVSQYLPEEVSVKTVDGKLVVHAKHEEKTETRSAYREFNKEFSLPIGTDPGSIKSTLSRDGILTVEAPLPQQHPAIGYTTNQPISNF